MMTDAVETGEAVDALGFTQRVRRDDFFERQLAEYADGDHQQAPVGHHRLFLRERELLHQGLVVGHLPRQIGKLHPEHAADGVDAGQGQIAGAREHALDARLGHAQALRQMRVGEASGLEFSLECENEIGGGCHGIYLEYT